MFEKIVTTLEVNEVVELQGYLTEAKRVGKRVRVIENDRHVTFQIEGDPTMPRTYPKRESALV